MHSLLDLMEILTNKIQYTKHGENGAQLIDRLKR